MASLSESLIDMIQKILSHRGVQDDEVFYDRALDALIDGNAHIIVGAPDRLQQSNVVNQHQFDNNLACTRELASSETPSGKLEPSMPELPGMEAPDAWI